jgi:hypothetical protein
MIFAAILHDLGRTDYLHKRRTPNIPHGSNGWNMILKYVELSASDEIFKAIDSNRRIFEIAGQMIESHMHHWEGDPRAKLPKELYEYIFATADYCASRREINTPVVNNKLLLEMENGQPIKKIV